LENKYLVKIVPKAEEDLNENYRGKKDSSGVKIIYGFVSLPF